MDEYECGSSGVWNIHSDISLDDMVISVCPHNADVALDLDWEGELLEMDSKDKLQPVSQ